jgi:protein mago nashi
MAKSGDFYCRYHVSNKGTFTEYEVKENGVLKYANGCGEIIRRNCTLSSAVLTEIRRIILDSGILNEIDTRWPDKDSTGGQELEIRIGNEHISFTCSNIGSVAEIDRFYKKENIEVTTDKPDPLGLKSFFYLGQDLRVLIQSLIKTHFSTRAM